MNADMATALAGLGGAAIGGLTSFGTNWLTQTTQLREQSRSRYRQQREALYMEFMEEASRLYADALSHEQNDLEKLVGLYSITAHIRLVSPMKIVEAAERVIDVIIDAYTRPNRTLVEMKEFAAGGGLDPLHEFARLCREELARFRSAID
jgi:hypothetical protein